MYEISNQIKLNRIFFKNRNEKKTLKKEKISNDENGTIASARQKLKGYTGLCPQQCQK